MSTSNFHYLAYGLNILSDLECPELVPGNGAPPDVRIHFGDVPERLDSPQTQGGFFQITPKQFLLSLAPIARFLVANGNEITIDRTPEASDNDLRVFLLGSVLAALLYQRSVLPLHASVIEMPQGAVALAGPIGHGKSTLAAAFYRRGYRVLADDVCAVTLDGGRPVVIPAYPRLNLWADALEVLGEDKENLPRTRIALEKYSLPVSKNFSNAAIPLIAVHFLDITNTDELSLTPVKGVEKTKLLMNNLYRPRFLEGMDQRDPYLRIVLAAAQHIRAARIVRPRGGYLLNELVELVERDWRV